MDDGILHEASEQPEGFLNSFRSGHLYSMLDIMGAGRTICDKCGRWQNFSAPTPSMAGEQLARYGWKHEGDTDLCPKCS